jgi:CRISPR/Cas system CSM-associated protein Csm4 (group 5 of RAMP superfamily)
MDEQNGNYFYRGTFYDTQEEWEKGVVAYNKSRVTSTSLSEMIKSLEKDLYFNLIEIRRTKISNIEMSTIIANSVIWILNRCSDEETN